MALSKITNGGITGMSVSSTDVTVSSGDLLFGTAAKGVCLGVTSNTDVNTLYDYERGTFTVTDNSGAGLSLTTNVTPQYIKIGNLVFVNFYITYPATSSSSAASITGFPFTSDGYSYLIGRTLNSGANDMAWQLNGSAAIPYYNNGALVNSALTSSYVLLSGCYYTSQ